MKKISDFPIPYPTQEHCYQCNETYVNDTHSAKVKCPMCGQLLMRALQNA